MNSANYANTINSYAGIESDEFASIMQGLTSSVLPPSKLAFAVNLYAIGSQTLLQRSMLVAGFTSTNVAEWSAQQIQVALELYDLESKRLCNLMGCTVACKRGCLKQKLAVNGRRSRSAVSTTREFSKTGRRNLDAT
jgi:hypothetical protein